MRARLVGLLGSSWCKAAFTALAVFICWLAFTPDPPRSMDLGWDKANHASAFAALSLVAAWAWPQRLRWLPAALLAYGGFIEIVQSFIPGRDGEWLDLLADAIGICVGLALFTVVLRLLKAQA